MGCTSSKEPQVTTTTRTEKTAEGYKHITEKRTKHPGLFGGETVETVTATVGGNPRLVAMIEDGMQYDLTDGKALYEFSKGSSVRVALQKLILREAIGVASGAVDLDTRTMSFGPYTMPCMLVGILGPSDNSVKFTWGWAHPAWDEKADAPVKRLQLVGQTLNNKDLKSDALLVDSPARSGRGENVALDAINAAAQVLGWDWWCSLGASDGNAYLLIGNVDAVKPPLPAAGLRKADLRDLHAHFKEIWDSMSPATFNDGVVGLARTHQWAYQPTGDGWAISEASPDGRRLVFRWDGTTNAAGEPLYEHTLSSVTPVVIEGVGYDIEVAHTIKSHEGPSTEVPSDARSTDCKQLFDFAKDTYMYSNIRSCSWLKAAAVYLGASKVQELTISHEGPNGFRLTHASKPGPVLVVPCDIVATVNENTRVLEWSWGDTSTASPAANQIRSAGVDLQNSDLSSAKLAVASGIDMQDVGTVAGLVAAKATGLHVFATYTQPDGVALVALLRVHEVKQLATQPLDLPAVFHGFDTLWPLRGLFDLQDGAKHLAARQGWHFSTLQTPLPGWVLTDPDTGSSFTFQDDHVAKETGDEYKIALDSKIMVDLDGGPVRLNVHINNCLPPPQN